MVINNSNGNVSIGNTDTATHKLNVTGDINVSGAFRVNGTVLSTGGSSQWVTSGANIYYNNGNVGIGVTTNVQSKLTINQQPSGTFDHSEAPLTITNTTPTSITAINDPKAVLHLCRPGTGGQSYPARATFKLCRYENVSANSRSRLDIILAHGQYDDITAMSIASNGNIGIGKTNPSSKLHIPTLDSGTIQNMIDFRNPDFGVYLTSASLGNSGNSLDFRSTDYNSGNVANRDLMFLKAAGVIFPNGFTNNSDSRIKKDIEDINDDTALNKLLLIQPKTYNYIEEGRNKGFGKVYGFIAQQIREVIPEAIVITEQYTPNIYKSCLIKNKREVYHSIPLDTPIDTFIMINNYSYKIKEIYEEYFVIDNDIDTDEAFVFGYNVDDFHTLNKDYIFTLNVCATQELHRRIEAQNIIIKSHEDRIKDLEEKVERLLTNT
jgi:hypothetical protein